MLDLNPGSLRVVLELQMKVFDEPFRMTEEMSGRVELACGNGDGTRPMRQ